MHNERHNIMSMRSEYCGLVTEALLGQSVSLCGWVHRRRDHGGVIFVDLRDREGLVQVVCDPDRAEMFKVAEGVRNEFCVQVKGGSTRRASCAPRTSVDDSGDHFCRVPSGMSSPPGAAVGPSETMTS